MAARRLLEILSSRKYSAVSFPEWRAHLLTNGGGRRNRGGTDDQPEPDGDPNRGDIARPGHLTCRAAPGARTGGGAAAGRVPAGQPGRDRRGRGTDPGRAA